MCERNTCKRVEASAVSVVSGRSENAQYKDLIYHSEVRWLRRGKVLERFFALVKEPNIINQEWYKCCNAVIRS